MLRTNPLKKLFLNTALVSCLLFSVNFSSPGHHLFQEDECGVQFCHVALKNHAILFHLLTSDPFWAFIISTKNSMDNAFFCKRNH